MKKGFRSKVVSLILMVTLMVMPISVSAAETTWVKSDTVSAAGNTEEKLDEVSREEIRIDNECKPGPTKEEVAGTQENDILQSALKSKVKAMGNNYPVVLVHGLFGWGNNEVLGKNYWGWDSSIRDMLNAEGFQVYTPTVGPIASNWDRACELYAYLVGGTVDYGQAHAEKAGHSRYGRTYPGVLKDLGTIDENGDVKKIHLMGHSMGGETSRVLAQLLENGSQEEVAKTSENTSPLFTGGKHWIESITTITTPHDGSQFDEVQNDLEPYFHRFIGLIAAQSGGLNEKDVIYDFKMEQWGLKRNPGESQESYTKRVFQSSFWRSDNKDLSLWDLSLEGAAELNSFAKAQSDIYYFSISCSDTHKSLISNHQLPNINMDPLIRYSGTVMGCYTENRAGRIPVDSNWFENDGLVSKRSGMGPHSGSTDKIVDFSGTPQVGVWNYLGNISNVDHLEVIFQRQPWDKSYLQNEYRTWVKMVRAL